MKIRIVGAGFETYTGQMGVIDFVDGVSTDDVSTRDAQRLAACVPCEWVESTKPVSPSSIVLESGNVEAPVLPEREKGAEVEVLSPGPEALTSELKAFTGNLEDASPLVQLIMKPSYKLEVLEKIIDGNGIAGLREIAEPLGIKGRSISDILDALKEGGFVEVAG